MKKKFTRILGVVLPLVMVLTLAVCLLPASTPDTAEAAIGTLRFSNIPLPKIGSAGKYVLTPASDVGPIAVAPAGNVLFAAADITDPNTINTLLQSTDGGYTWALQTDFRIRATAKTDNTSIVAIETSPEYSTDTTVFVATEDWIYQSVDGGKAFTAMARPTGWDTDEVVTDMDITLDSGGRLSIIIGSEETSGTGDVYVYSPATTGMTWKEQGIGKNVLAAAFSPGFASDDGIFAIVTDNVTIRAQFGATDTGLDWGDDIGDGVFRDNDGLVFAADRARIAFPDDFDVDSITSNIAFVGLYAGSQTDPAAMTGDVYQVTFQPGPGNTSTTSDLNVRGLVSTIRTATNIWSIDVSGDAEAASIVVGTDFWSTGVPNYYWTAYYSSDSGVNWSAAREKSPTGASTGFDATPDAGAQTIVLMAPDFATSGVAYAATSGAKTSALSLTANSGKSWNQISLIDYANTSDNYTIKQVKVDGLFPITNTMYLVTQVAGANGALWKSTNGGANYERIFSYANPTATDTIDYCYAVATAEEAYLFGTIFARDKTVGKFWRSSDSGATFPRIISAKAPGFATSSITNPTTIYTIYADGSVYYTTTLGRPWIKPDESDIVAGAPQMFGIKGDTVVVAILDASMVVKLFISTDGGEIFEGLGISDPGYGGAGYFGFDPNYDTNHYLYVALYGVEAYAMEGGIYRIEVNEDDPDSTEWKRIDDSTNSPRAAFVVTEWPFFLGSVFYVSNAATVQTGDVAGGFWRSVNASADIDGIYPPRFVNENTGLPAGAIPTMASACVMPNTIILKDKGAAYYNQLYAFGDTISSPVMLVAPDDGAANQGIRLDLTLLTQTVVMSWEPITGATSYQWQLAADSEFRSVWNLDYTTGQQARVAGLMPGMTYYWRVRVAKEGTIGSNGVTTTIGAPVISPWSETRTFAVAEYAPEVVVPPFDIISPQRGATDVSIQPSFVWAEVEGAVSYELVVAEDPTFAIIDWSRTSANPFYKAEEALAYSTTYAWKVRAAPAGPWATGVFTTEAAPVEPVEPIVIEPTAPAEIKIVEIPAAAPIPTYLLWTIIGVGAVLFIALIVLIVRTRRVT